jgi:hypothetical protein
LTFANNADAIIRAGGTVNLVTIENKNITDMPVGSIGFYDVNLSIQSKRDSDWYFSFGYIYLVSKVPITSTSSSLFSSNNPYFGISVFVVPDLMLFSANFSPYTQGTYSETGTANEIWYGNSYNLKMSYRPYISEGITLDFSFVFYGAAYGSKSTAATVTTTETFVQSLVAPTIGIFFNF